MKLEVKKMIDFNEEEYKKAQAFDGETVKLPAGGYICKILNVKNEKSKNGKKMLSVALDIAEGEFSGFFMSQYENRKKTSNPENPAKFPNAAVVRYVLEGDYWLNRFKGLMTSLEKSNDNFNWLECNHDENKIKGLHVGAIFGEEEYEKIGEMADRSGLTYLWLGAKLQSDTEEWKQAGWITGEDWTFDNWYPGEPSRQDADGTKELFLCMWKAKYNEEEIGWTFNDQRNDIVGAFPKIAGKVGYVCEYERETNG